jgi:hypothetical protein
MMRVLVPVRLLTWVSAGYRFASVMSPNGPKRLLLLALLLASPIVARAAQAAEGTATKPSITAKAPEQGYGGHQEGSRKGKVHQLFDTQFDHWGSGPFARQFGSNKTQLRLNLISS